MSYESSLLPEFSRLLSDLSEEQQAAVLSTARITVVPACPGSGKTRVFAARFAYEVHRHRKGFGGVAALSFTKVAEQEIRIRLATGGIAGSHPHFIGTIDAFLLRYVIRIFAGELVNLRYFERPFAVEERAVQLGNVAGSPHEFCLGQHQLLRENRYTVLDLNKDRIVDQRRIKTVIAAKKEAWLLGQLTHDDVCFIGAYLLEKPSIRSIILKRFPVLLIDEFQDTGGSREDAMFSLMADLTLNRGLVVGDPDQCIMGFTGAKPELFDRVLDLHGAEKCDLTTTHRFHRGIVEVVSPFAKELRSLRAKEGSILPPRSTILLTHTFKVQSADLSLVPCALRRFHQQEFSGSLSSVALLTWRGNTAARLKGTRKRDDPQFSSRWLSILFAGLKRWRKDEAVGLFGNVERIMVEATGFRGTVPTRQEMQERGYDPREWKQMVWHTAQSVVLPSSDVETVGEWIERLKVQLPVAFERGGIDTHSISHNIRLNKTRLKETASQALVNLLDETCEVAVNDLYVEKVHQVKGKEFETVCFFVPTPRAGELPVQTAWFGPAGTEESWVAYVAMTRAKKALMLVIPQSWAEDLSTFALGRQFLESFSFRGTLEGYLSTTEAADKPVSMTYTLPLAI